MRAIRGAISVEKNNRTEILQSTKELLEYIIKENAISTEEMVSITFTATDDLDSVYPAVAARELGLDKVPLLCFQEMRVKNSLRKCIRVMLYVSRNCPLDEIKHVYLKKAAYLRPDL
ncbi:MAG: chorismate mutase [Halanaerobiales bacterium]